MKYMKNICEKLFIKDSGFYRMLVTLALPTMLQGLINIGVNLMDTM